MSIRSFKSTAFAPIAPTRVRTTGYEYRAFPVDQPEIAAEVVPIVDTIDLLVIAGGGAGGVDATAASGGGGGAGGYLYTEGYSIIQDTEYTITVGAGGSAGGDGGDSGIYPTASPGALQTTGGIAGYVITTPDFEQNGGDSGAPTTMTGGSGTSSGAGGGAGANPVSGGGGGGSPPVNGGAGGDGVNSPADFVSDIGFPSSVCGGGGGGGGEGFTGGDGGAGGLGGGGTGGGNFYVPTDGASYGAGGGGMAGVGMGYGVGTSGADGVVVIRYLGSPIYTGGTITEASGYTYHLFESSGTLTPI